MTDDDGMIAGFRVLRRLGGGRRSDVYLGVRPSGGEPVALKVFRADEPEAGRDAELSILTTVTAPSLPAFVDVSSVVGGGLCVILEQLPGPTLAQLLASRRHLADGEVVTLLAPLVATVSLLHAAGYSLGAVNSRSLRFTADGRPVLTSLHDARALSTHDGSARNAAIRCDYGMLAGFVDELAALIERESLPVAELLHAARVGRPLDDPLPIVERRLFAWAPPLPVVLGADGMLADPIPARLGGVLAAGSVETDAGTGGAADVEAGAWAARWAAWADEGPLRRLAVRALPLVRGRRRPMIVGGALAAAVTTALLVTMPVGAAGGVDRSASHTAGTPTPSSAAGPTTAAQPIGSPGVLTADDPVAAASVLLSARSACLAGTSATCLTGVDEADSPLAEADAAAVQSRSESLDIPSSAVLAVSGRTGDAVVLSATLAAGGAETTTASLLLMKGEAGWRLREIFVD